MCNKSFYIFTLSLYSMNKSMLSVVYQKLVMFVLFCGLIIFSSCDKKSDPDVTDGSVSLPTSIVGKTFTGDVSYTSASNPIPIVAAGTGKVTITQTSTNTYTISFSVPTGIPSIVGLQFLGSDGSYASVSSSNSVTGITIDEDSLQIGVTSNGATWAASVTR